MEYTVGEKVVVPVCGVGEIADIKTLDIEDHSVDMIEIDLRLRDDGTRIWIPVDRIEEEGLRPVMTPQTARKALDTISQQTVSKRRQHWNQRKRRYTEMLTSNQPGEMARLLGELAAVQKKKPLSFNEKKMFSKVWRLLVAEMAVVQGTSRESISETIQDITAVSQPI